MAYLGRSFIFGEKSVGKKYPYSRAFRLILHVCFYIPMQ